METNHENPTMAQSASSSNTDLTEETSRTEEELRNILSRHVVVI